MTTAASDIYDLFTSYTRDYRIDTVYFTSGSPGLNTYLEPWLLASIVEFDDMCDQSLVYTKASDTGTGDGEFTADLTLKNQIILALMMVKYWMETQIQDVVQMSNHLQDRDFKTHSAAQNLRAKQDYLIQISERISSRLVEYGYAANNWASWKLQDFD